MIVDVLLFGYRSYQALLTEVGLSVVQCDDFEEAAAAIVGAEELKVLLFEGSRQGGSGYDLARILRATHRRSLVGQSLPAPLFANSEEGEWTFVHRTKPLPRKMDFFLTEPFAVADVAELVTRYDRGESGPPRDWTGWFSEPEELDALLGLGSPTDPEEFAWVQEAMVEDMRNRLSRENFDAWLQLIGPGMEERLRRVRNWHDTYCEIRAPRD